jgi:serine/threonine protein kinase/Tol biopolymer transport system component
MVREPLLELALAIADGSAIDWDASARADLPQSMTDELRLVERLAQLHARTPVCGDEPPAAGAPLDTWGPLRIIEPIGRGTFGDVYKARDPRLDRPVALKLVRRREPGESTVIEEARLMARVRHPHVITVHGAERIEGRVGFWMEFLEGETLEEELIRRGPFEPREVAAIGATLASALTAVHRAGLVHRDIKAHNVMRDSEGRLVLTDFGAGRELNGRANGVPELAGTPLYLAPEILAGGDASPASDVYSLGVLLYRLACGSFPIVAESLRDLRAAHQRRAWPRLRAIRPGVPRPLAAAIERALEADPNRRISTAQLESRLRDTASTRRTRGLIALSALTLVTTASVWWLAERTRTGPLSTSSVSVTAIDAAFQKRVNIRSPSSDSRIVTCTPWGRGSVAVCDLVALTVREVRVPSTRRERSPQAILSRDLKHIAYAWDDGAQLTIRLIRTDGSGDRELVGPQAGHTPSIVQWTHDGKAIVLVDTDSEQRRRLRTIPVDGGPTRDLREFGPQDESLSMELSPDERYLVYSRPAPQEPGHWKVILADVMSGRETTLPGTSNDYGPRWAPDGRAVVFGSDRYGTHALFSTAISNGKPVGEPHLVRDLGRSTLIPLGFSDDGTLFIRAIVNWLDIFRAPIDLAGGTIGSLVRADPRSVNENVSPDWSPDDSRFAFLSGAVGHPLESSQVELHRRDGSIDRVLPLPSWLNRSARARWSPDGTQLAVVWEEPQRVAVQSINLVDVSTNAIRRIATGREIWEVKWDPRGGEIYYAEGRSIRRVNAATGESSVVYQSSPGASIATDLTTFDVAPDGTAIAFISQSASGRGVRILSLTDGHIIERYTFKHECRGVAWSRDGRQLLVSGSDSQTLQPGLFVMDVAGGQPRPLNVKTEYIVDFSLSHDDRELLLATGNPRPDYWMLRGFRQ